MARPLIDIDPEEVRKLAQLGCKNDEIADFLGCSAQTVETRFQPEIDKGRSELKISLRRMQIQAAQRGNVAMMIWLGKQMLGQIDRAQIDITKVDDETFIAETRRRLGDGSEKPRDIETISIKESKPKT